MVTALIVFEVTILLGAVCFYRLDRASRELKRATVAHCKQLRRHAK